MIHEKGVTTLDVSDASQEQARRELNEEAAYSLSLNRKETDPEGYGRMAEKMIQVSERDADGIAALVHVFLQEDPTLTNGEVAAKVLKELANSHPNRFIKKLAKRMVPRKRGTER